MKSRIELEGIVYLLGRHCQAVLRIQPESANLRIRCDTLVNSGSLCVWPILQMRYSQ